MLPGECFVLVHHVECAAGGALVFALSCDPGPEGREGTSEGLDFSDAATLFVSIFVEAKESLLFDKEFEFGGIWRHQLDLDGVVFADIFDKSVGVGVESACIEAKYRKVESGLHGHIDQYDIFGTAECEPTIASILCECPGQDLLWCAFGGGVFVFVVCACVRCGDVADQLEGAGIDGFATIVLFDDKEWSDTDVVFGCQLHAF